MIVFLRLRAGALASALLCALAALAFAPAAQATCSGYTANTSGVTANGQLEALSEICARVTAPAALAAGENHIGQVGGYTFIASASFVRPAVAASDVSGDVLCPSATAGSCAPMSFTVSRINGGSGSVRRARIKTTDTAYAGASGRLHIYKNSPTPTNGDSGVWLTTESLEFCEMDFTLNRHFTDAEKGIGVPIEGSECSFDTAAGSQVVYGYIEARGTVTSGSAKTWTVVLEGFGD